MLPKKIRNENKHHICKYTTKNKVPLRKENSCSATHPVKYKSSAREVTI